MKINLFNPAKLAYLARFSGVLKNEKVLICLGVNE
jgi:hypothetical protein